jgi:serine/threonine protein kinase
MGIMDRERWLLLQPLLDLALELPDDQRASWLEELRARSPEMAAEVASILSKEADADRRDFLLDLPRMSLEGLEVGAYTLERLLGHGGMGTVWLARRTDGRFEGRAAVKLMNLALLDPTGEERFRREGTALARLAHPGIARLLDAGVAPTRQPYLVIEHIDGERIDAFAEARGLPAPDRIGLVLQVLEALAHAHANLVVHRDIKPSNILVTADGTAKLLDFGIAKLLEGGTGEGGSAITIEESPALTPQFAAPEQVQGGAITTATDVYAVGALLYLLLSGRHPTAEGCRTPGEAIAALLEKNPARLRMGDLDTVLAKALRKTPRERYQTAAAFAEDLRRYLAQQPVSARPDSLSYRTRKFVRRNHSAVVLAAATALALIGATVFSVVQMQEARAQRNVAVRAARRAVAMSELQGVLAGDARSAEGRPLSTADRIALAERLLVRQFRGEPWLVADVMIDLSERFAESGDLRAQRRMLARAGSIARDANLPSQLAHAHCERATNYWLEDRIDSARADLVEARAALGRVPGRVGPEVEATCAEAEGQMLQAEGRADSGIVLLRRALALTEADSNAMRTLTLTYNLAELLRQGGRPREAVPYVRRVLAGLVAAGYGDTEKVPNVVSLLWLSLLELGEFTALDSSLRGLIREHEAVHGAARVPTAVAFFYGYGKLRLGELDSAEVWVGRAARDTTQRQLTLVDYLPGALSQLRLDQGRVAQAREAVARLPDDRRRGQRATAAALRARLRRLEGDSAGASALLERELHVLLSDGQPALTWFSLPLATAGEWRLAAGDAHGADSLARLARAVAAIDSVAGVRSGLVGRAELLRARALRAQGDLPDARRAAADAGLALANGYGADHPWTRAARALVDSLAS